MRSTAQWWSAAGARAGRRSRSARSRASLSFAIRTATGSSSRSAPRSPGRFPQAARRRPIRALRYRNCADDGASVIELAAAAADHLVDWLGKPLRPRLLRKALEDEPAVLPVDHTGRTHGACEQLGSIAAARAELGDLHAGLDAEEGEHLGRVSAAVERTVFGG